MNRLVKILGIALLVVGGLVIALYALGTFALPLVAEVIPFVLVYNVLSQPYSIMGTPIPLVFAVFVGVFVLGALLVLLSRRGKTKLVLPDSEESKQQKVHKPRYKRGKKTQPETALETGLVLDDDRSLDVGNNKVSTPTTPELTVAEVLSPVEVEEVNVTETETPALPSTAEVAEPEEQSTPAVQVVLPPVPTSTSPRVSVPPPPFIKPPQL